MRFEGARACGEIVLEEAVGDLEELADDVDPEVQEAALWALGQIGGNRAQQVLERYCLSGDENTRQAAEAAMAELEFLHGELSDLFDESAAESD
jgi:HEAT repeat protein